MFLSFFHDSVTDISEIISSRSDIVRGEGFTEHEHGITVRSQRIFTEMNGFYKDFGIVGDGLFGGRSIVSPDFEIGKLGDFFLVHFSF